MNEYENQLKTHPDHFVIENIFSCIATDIFYCNELFDWLSWFIAIAKHFTQNSDKTIGFKNRVWTEAKKPEELFQKVAIYR